jgi:Sap, sulfolipid-1-addressing protein
MLELAPLALASAVDPVLIASVAVMLSRGSPAKQLVAYLVGGAGVSVGAGVLIVLALGRAGLGVGSGGGESTAVDEGAGVTLLITAIVVATGVGRRFAARVKVGRLDHADAESGGRGPGRRGDRCSIAYARASLRGLRGLPASRGASREPSTSPRLR